MNKLQNIESEELMEEEENELDSVKLGDHTSDVEIQNHESEPETRKEPELNLKRSESVPEKLEDIPEDKVSEEKPESVKSEKSEKPESVKESPISITKSKRRPKPT